jgi:excisionase family DNA binding protein
MATNKSEAMTTGQVALVLGTSVSLVQRMVQNNQLEAWVTAGGHRRIARSEVEKFLSKIDKTKTVKEKFLALKILIVEDDPMYRSYLEMVIRNAKIDANIISAVDAFDALIKMERHRPHLVITDLNMAPLDGFELIKSTQSVPEYASMEILVITQLEIDNERILNEIPRWVKVYHKSVSDERILGYLESTYSHLFRNSN